TVYVADLPDNQLGLEDDGEIWIDQNAAGWGWTLGGSPAQGRMDLATVVTHEIGHALGFGHSDLGVMEAALTPGARLVPESGPLAATSATASTPLAAASPFSVLGGAGAPAVRSASGATAVGSAARGTDVATAIAAARAEIASPPSLASLGSVRT